MFPFVIDTEFVASIRARKEAASQMLSEGGLQAQQPEQVAAAILHLIKTGQARADLVPEQFGGTLPG
jgi:hypothetical protein